MFQLIIIRDTVRLYASPRELAYRHNNNYIASHITTGPMKYELSLSLSLN
jgi:hypothetical protein